MPKTPSFADAEVERVFAGYPSAVRKKLLAVRALIFQVAASTPGVGALEETLKWGEPAYLTSETRSGSTVRIAWKKAKPTQYAIYFNCQTTLVDTFRTLFPDELRFEGKRAIVFDEGNALPTDAIAFCIAAALTYHRANHE
jgi:hypothetical protein